MKRVAILVSLLLISGITLSGCGGSAGGGSNGPSVLISPTLVIVPVGLTAQFTATPSGLASTNVNWQVNGITGGNSTIGMISTTGLYTAPSAVPNPAAVTVTAISSADNKTTSLPATVTIIPASLVTVSPAAVPVPAGGTQQFMASIAGVPSNQVIWQVNGIAGGNSAIGTINSQGLFTAPLTPPPGGSVTITALAQNSQNISGSATATITFSNASLQGSYAFAFTGTALSGFLTVAGSFQADGKGNLTAGLMDVNSGAGIATNLSLTGTYAVGPDGRASAQMKTSFGTFDLRLALISNLHAFVIQFDGTATASGTIDIQNPSAFSNTAIAGNYAFNFSGIDAVGNPVNFGGAFLADGGGTIQTGAADIVSALALATNLPLSGAYNVASSGRGTATISSAAGTFHFSFYVASAGDLKFVELDPVPALSGEVLAQPAGPLGNGTVSGNYVFTIGGTSAAGPLAIGGVFSADGNGNIKNGVADFNNNGTVTQNQAFSGTYAVAANGRGTATFNTPLGTLNFALYPAANGIVEFLEIDASAITSGSANGQQNITFSPATIKGSYAVNFDGINSGGELDAVAQLTTGTAGAWQGLLDLNNHGTLSTGLQASGAYTLAANGRGTATLQTSAGTRHLIVYAASGSTIFFIGADGSEVIAGQIANQF